LSRYDLAGLSSGRSPACFTSSQEAGPEFSPLARGSRPQAILSPLNPAPLGRHPVRSANRLTLSDNVRHSCVTPSTSLERGIERVGLCYQSLSRV